MSIEHLQLLTCEKKKSVLRPGFLSLMSDNDNNFYVVDSSNFRIKITNS